MNAVNHSDVTGRRVNEFIVHGFLCGLALSVGLGQEDLGVGIVYMGQDVRCSRTCICNDWNVKYEDDYKTCFHQPLSGQYCLPLSRDSGGPR
jgi:hypothetical protein